MRSNVTLERTVCGAAPAADGLVRLLAPWDRARLRLTCRALAAAVPVRSCVPSMSAMVRAPGGGAALLRYGAGDVRPRWVHLLVAAEADAADGMRWLLSELGVVAQKVLQRLARAAARTGSAGVWRVLAPRLRLADHPCAGLWWLRDAMKGGSEPVAAEIAEAHADRMMPRDYMTEEAVFRLRFCFREAARRDMPSVLAPFLRRVERGPAQYVVARRAVQGAHFRMGGPLPVASGGDAASVLCAALLAGRVDLAPEIHRVLVATGGDVDVDMQRRLLECALQARRNAYETIDWLVGTLGLDLRELPPGLARSAVEADAPDALRWWIERTGSAPHHHVSRAIRRDSAACFAYLLELGTPPALGMFAEGVRSGSHRVMALLAARLRPLSAEQFLRLAGGLSSVSDATGVHAMSLLRRHALLPPPGVAFLRACADTALSRAELCALPMAGYRVDADALGWLDSVRPHCAGTPEDEWRALGHKLRARWDPSSI